MSLLTDLAARAPVPTAAPGRPSTADGAPAAPRLDLGTLRRIAASGDPELSVLVAKTMSLLLTPQEVFGDPEVVRRLSQAAAVERPRDPSRPRRVPLTRERSCWPPGAEDHCEAMMASASSAASTTGRPSTSMSTRCSTPVNAKRPR